MKTRQAYTLVKNETFVDGKAQKDETVLVPVDGADGFGTIDMEGPQQLREAVIEKHQGLLLEAGIKWVDVDVRPFPQK